jgi:hypothetical protein
MNDIQPTGTNRYRRSVAFQRAHMCSGVYTRGKATDNDMAFGSQHLRYIHSSFSADWCRIPATDNSEPAAEHQ